MPIAHCILKTRKDIPATNVIELWSKFAGIDKSEMTINFVAASEQIGKEYEVMATLYLPSLWSNDKTKSIQLGLARALAESLNLPIESIHIILLIVDSGHVVENGKVQNW